MIRIRDRVSPGHAARSGTGLFVSGGTVPCPLRGDVSVETCLACASLRAVDGDPVRRIQCRPGAGSMAEVARHLAL